MFFRREKPKVPSFSERLSNLAQAGFQTADSAGGKSRVSRNGFAAEISDTSREGVVEIGVTGVLVGNEIGVLVDLGYQKAFQTPSGRKVPALAEHLRGLHDFTEDLREELNLTSLYNQGLGSTNELHVYDRVAGRDAGVRKPWRKEIRSTEVQRGS